jgi:hypothetical protein
VTRLAGAIAERRWASDLENHARRCGSAQLTRCILRLEAFSVSDGGSDGARQLACEDLVPHVHELNERVVVVARRRLRQPHLFTKHVHHVAIARHQHITERVVLVLDVRHDGGEVRVGSGLRVAGTAGEHVFDLMLAHADELIK